MQDYLDACKACEICIRVTSEKLLQSIRGSLFYDRRTNKGYNGRALRFPIHGTELLPGDRLEPTASFPDVGMIDGMSVRDLPISLFFFENEASAGKAQEPAV